MSFSFHHEAENEFNKAIDYYEDIEPRLGYDFALEVYSTIKRSVELPKALVSARRRCQKVFGKAIPVWNLVF